MKRVLAMLCTLALILSLGILPASAATGDVMKLQYVTLRTQEGKEGIYFGATFALTQATITAMGNTGCYGLAATTTPMADDAAWAAAMGNKVQYSSYKDGLTAGQATYVRSTSVVNIININNDSSVNTRNADTTIYVRPYVKLADGSYIFGAAGEISMKLVAQMIDEIYSTLSDEQKKGLLGMYERFSASMKGWGLTNLKADYTNGNPLILEYRREKVVANMQAQADILWSFTGTDPIVYSRRPTSYGLDTDLAEKPGDVYTIYPGRVYKGIPYTHGSSGLDIYYTMGTQNSDGVYVIDGLNSSFLSGGTNRDTYNMSRMGNDCWDAISWAYETVGSSVTADQTNQVTPAYGMYPVGPYGEGENSLFNLFMDDGGKVLKTFNTVYADNFANNAENRQLIYESYALMQPGDTMVHYVENAGGHALMAISVNVVRNTDGTINPDQSSVTYIEQGSGHEKAQSVDFDLANLTSQSVAHSGGHNSQGIIQIPGDPATCKQCAAEAGYDASTGIWTLNPGQATDTFTTLFDDGGYYIPMTSEELRNPTAKIPVNRIADSVSNTSNVANIFTGKISSTYRISQITLDIYDAGGNKVNTSTCFSIQNGLTQPFNLVRFVNDQGGAYGSVLDGTPAIVQKSKVELVTDAEGNQVYVYTEDANGTYYNSGTAEEPVYTEVPAEGVEEGTVLYSRTEKTKTVYWLEADSQWLAEGEYSFTMTCKLVNGFERTFRSGVFAVTEGTNLLGQTALLVTVSAN